MAITISKKVVQSIAVDVVQEAVAKAEAEGKDPYLAGTAAKLVLIGVDMAKDPSKGIQITIKPKPYTILDAMMDLHNHKKTGTLSIIRSSDGQTYIVDKFDPLTSKARLKGENGKTLTPMITDRECQLYIPVWR